jgi:hypothetical protein
MLGLNLEYLQQLCRDGRIAGAEKRGRAWWIPLDSVLRRGGGEAAMLLMAARLCNELHDRLERAGAGYDWQAVDDAAAELLGAVERLQARLAPGRPTRRLIAAVAPAPRRRGNG